MPQRYVAFLRAVNLGDTNALSKDKLRSLFLDAGACWSESFITSGNVIFDAEPSRLRTIQRQAAKCLAETHGIKQPIFVVSIPQLETIRAGFEEPESSSGDYIGLFVSFFEGRAALQSALPVRSNRQDVELFAFGPGFALSHRYRVSGQATDSNAFVERLIGKPCSTRNGNTVKRILEKYGGAEVRKKSEK
jgi:uncharacterized protein (DUF1697 family)